VRQRAAWSLSNVISALCEHDDKDGVAPAVALQGLAVATCATVRKCLNDNDKVPVFLYFQHLCLQFYIRFTSLHSHLYIHFFHRCIRMHAFMFTALLWHRFDPLESDVLECLGNLPENAVPLQGLSGKQHGAIFNPVSALASCHFLKLWILHRKLSGTLAVQSKGCCSGSPGTSTQCSFVLCFLFSVYVFDVSFVLLSSVFFMVCMC